MMRLNSPRRYTPVNSRMIAATSNNNPSREKPFATPPVHAPQVPPVATAMMMSCGKANNQDLNSTFQRDSAKRAGIFHHLITLPTYHTAALSTDNLAREYFGDAGMLGYVKNVQRAEIRQGIACVKHQNMSGSDLGDDHKEYFAGEAALKAGGAHNTMNQFAA